MIVIKRNRIIVICLAVLFATAGYLNFSYKSEDKAETARETVGEIHLVENTPEDYFESAKLEREISRAEVQETLANIIEDENSETQSKIMAEEEKIKVAKQSDDEIKLENIIKAKGYEDAVLFISDGKADAVIKSQNMTSEEATAIAGIITEQTGIPVSEITVTGRE
ncbi:MAG: SpoIIIAH-like family protein [Clostridia bacterium]|nr:SpoIIIAH-like family protein [Clostridia bacterium]